MLHFLRHIRQKLILQENVRKYLLYAIGEILLVVIGILIALQINNWNEANKEEEIMMIALRSLITDLEKDQNELNIDIEAISQDLDQLRGFKDRLSKPNASIDTLKQIARYEYLPFFNPSHEVNRSTIISLLNTGSIDLFEPEIKKKILTHNSRQLELVKVMDLNVQIWIAAENSTGINVLSENPFLDDMVVRGPLLDQFWKDIDEDEFLPVFLKRITNKLVMHTIISDVKHDLLDDTNALVTDLKIFEASL